MQRGLHRILLWFLSCLPIEPAQIRYKLRFVINLRYDWLLERVIHKVQVAAKDISFRFLLGGLKWCGGGDIPETEVIVLLLCLRLGLCSGWDAEI